MRHAVIQRVQQVHQVGAAAFGDLQVEQRIAVGRVKDPRGAGRLAERAVIPGRSAISHRHPRLDRGGRRPATAGGGSRPSGRRSRPNKEPQIGREFQVQFGCDPVANALWRLSAVIRRFGVLAAKRHYADRRDLQIGRGPDFDRP